MPSLCQALWLLMNKKMSGEPEREAEVFFFLIPTAQVEFSLIQAHAVQNSDEINAFRLVLNKAFLFSPLFFLNVLERKKCRT